jgi:hypothetical protein
MGRVSARCCQTLLHHIIVSYGQLYCREAHALHVTSLQCARLQLSLQLAWHACCRGTRSTLPLLYNTQLLVSRSIASLVLTYCY